MIDLHSHVLPNLDDGPSDLAGSVELAREAAGDGTRVLAATPHVRADHPGVRPFDLARRCLALGRELAEAEIPIEIVPGGEVDLLWAHQASEEQLRLVSYRQAGTDLLLETPYGSLPPGFEELVLAVARRGFRILLAHPERSGALQRRPERIAALVRRGVLIQVTAGSLASEGRRIPGRELAAALVNDGLAHVIASDAHAAASRRRAGLSAGAAVVAEIASAGRAEWMTTEVPAAILAGEHLPRPPVEHGGGRWWRSRLLPRRRAC